MIGKKCFTAKELAIVEAIRGIIEQIAEWEKCGKDTAPLYQQLNNSLTEYQDIRQGAKGNSAGKKKH